MARAKKKHVCSCGEEFNHGIGLRKHQRQSGHKGSSVIDDEGGDDEGDEEGGEAPAPAAAPPPQERAAPPPPAPVREAAPPPPVTEAPPPRETAPPPPARETPPPRAAAPPPPPVDDDDYDDEPDQTVPVNRRPGYEPQPVAVQQSWPPEYGEAPSRFQHNRQKLSLVSRGLRVVLSYRARSAGNQLKQSARSGADIFTEALKIAVSLLLIMAIPAGIFWWWWAQRKARPTLVDVPSSFTFEQGALSARSTVLQYLDALEKQRWTDAYAKLSGGWHEELSAVGFQEAFSGIREIRWAVNDQKLLPGGGAEVNLLIAYVEDGRPKKFQGRFRLTQEGQAWKVDRVELSSAPAVPPSSPKTSDGPAREATGS